MKILINNKPLEVKSGATLVDLATQLELPKDGIAVAIDYKVIPRIYWGSTVLGENEELIILEAVSGG